MAFRLQLKAARLPVTVVALLVVACKGPGADPPSPTDLTPPVQREAPDLAPVIRSELDELHAATSNDLGVDGSPRRLAAGAPWLLEHTEGTFIVPLVLEPVALRVPTEIGLSFAVVLDPAGVRTVSDRPSRADSRGGDAHGGQR